MRVEAFERFARRVSYLRTSHRVWTEARDSSTSRSSRDTDYYFRAFFFSPEQLRDKRVLDVGAGDSDFAEGVRALGASVVNLDPDYKKKPPVVETEWIASVAQNIPYPDESFDEVIASFSFFWMKTGLNDALKEALRVVKAGGKVKIHPAYPKPYALFELGTYVALKPVRDESFLTLEIIKDRGIKDLASFARQILDTFCFRAEPFPYNFYKDLPSMPTGEGVSRVE